MILILLNYLLMLHCLPHVSFKNFGITLLDIVSTVFVKPVIILWKHETFSFEMEYSRVLTQIHVFFIIYKLLSTQCQNGIDSCDERCVMTQSCKNSSTFATRWVIQGQCKQITETYWDAEVTFLLRLTNVPTQTYLGHDWDILERKWRWEFVEFHD